MDRTPAAQLPGDLAMRGHDRRSVWSRLLDRREQPDGALADRVGWTVGKDIRPHRFFAIRTGGQVTLVVWLDQCDQRFDMVDSVRSNSIAC